MRIPLSGMSFWRSFFRRIPRLPGRKAYVVGGWVRDMLMLRRPTRPEIDLALEGDAVQWGEAIAESFGVRIGRVSEFRTCKIDVLHDKVPVRIDIASCRTDDYPVPGGMPVVTPSSIYEDLYRRDFSVNAMAFPLEEPFQNSFLLMDPVGGYEDLVRKELRILSPASFEDDPVRIFRLFRFQERLGFTPDLRTSRALESARLNGAFLRSSKSRLWDEIQAAIREESRCAIVFRWLLEKPWENALPSLKMSSPRRKRVFAWDRLTVHESVFSPLGRFWREMLLLLALFYGLPRQECDRGLRLLGVPEKRARVVRESLFPVPSENGREKTAQSDILPNLSPQMIFLNLVRGGPETFASFEKALADRDQQPLGEMSLTGRDLIKEGIEPSPEMGNLLIEIRELREKGILNSRQEELDWVRAWVRSRRQKS